MGGADSTVDGFDPFPLRGKGTRRENYAKKVEPGLLLTACLIGICGTLAEISATWKVLGQNAPILIVSGCFAPPEAGPFIVDNLWITCCDPVSDWKEIIPDRV